VNRRHLKRKGPVESPSFSFSYSYSYSIPTGSFENEYEYECENEQSWLLTTDYYSRDFINVPLSNVP
jgi:hypothetical protein